MAGGYTLKDQYRRKGSALSAIRAPAGMRPMAIPDMTRLHMRQDGTVHKRILRQGRYSKRLILLARIIWHAACNPSWRVTTTRTLARMQED